MWRIRLFFDFIFRKNILLNSFAIIMGIVVSIVLISLFNDVVLPLLFVVVIGKAPKDLNYIHEQIPGLTIRYGLFIQNLICFVGIMLIVFLFYHYFHRTQAKREKELAAKVKPTFRDGVNLEIRDYLKILPQIKDALINKK